MMASDPLSILILKFRGRGVAVLRDRCADYDVSRSPFSVFRVLTRTGQQSIIAVARSSLRSSLRQVPNGDGGDLILLASIPGYPDTSEVELTREVWPTVSSIVHSVTIALETGASRPVPSVECTVVSQSLPAS